MSSTPIPDTTSAPASAAEPPKRRGMQGNAKSMVLSMIACIAGCLVLIALIPRQGPTPRPTVNVNPIAREVSSETHWDVGLASGLTAPWRSVSAQMINGDRDHMKHWQVGYQGKDTDFVALEQAKSGGSKFVDQMASGEAKGSVNIGGVAWKKIELSSGDQKALVRSSPLGGLDTLVVGLGSWDKLTQVAAAVKPYSAAH